MIFSSSRRFQLWEYRVSHGSLLIRSPRGPGQDTNLDVLFDGVEFVSSAQMLRGLEVTTGDATDINFVEDVVGAVRLPDNIFILKSIGRRFFVVASSCRTDENDLDIFTSPFDFTGGNT